MKYTYTTPKPKLGRPSKKAKASEEILGKAKEKRTYKKYNFIEPQAEKRKVGRPKREVLPPEEKKEKRTLKWTRQDDLPVYQEGVSMEKVRTQASNRKAEFSFHPGKQEDRGKVSYGPEPEVVPDKKPSKKENQTYKVRTMKLTSLTSFGGEPESTVITNKEERSHNFEKIFEGILPTPKVIENKKKMGRPKGSGSLVKKAKDTKVGPGKPLFKKGEAPRSGGRPKGSRNKITVALEQIGEENAKDVYAKLVELALAGDVNACKIILDRVYPARRGLSFTLDFEEPLETAQDLNALSNHVVKMMTAGEISSEEALEIGKVIEQRLKVVTDIDLISKIEATCEKVKVVERALKGE
jgi:hypothetical protein